MRLPAPELRLAIRLLPLLEARRASMSASLARAGRLADADPGATASWANLYELPLRQHIARAAVAFEMDRELIAAARGELPMSALIGALERSENEPIEPPEDGPQGPVALGWAAFGQAHSLQCALRALLVFGVPLNALVASARNRGDDRALLNAIRIDPTVVSGRTGAQRLARACLEDDRSFIAALRNALHGKLARREEATLRRMRRVLRALAQAGAARLDDRDLSALQRSLLRLYPAAMRSGNAARDLRASANRFVDACAAKPAASREPRGPSREGKRG